jgi:hypothetical protein
VNSLLVGYAGWINCIPGAPIRLDQEEHLRTGAEQSRASAPNDLRLIRGEARRSSLEGAAPRGKRKRRRRPAAKRAPGDC